MAERGRETLRHGPMKPVGLTNPHKPAEKAYAVVQLRRDNKLGTLYNIVGFQTKMKYGAQTDVFRMIPGLQDASFARLGGIHRNTFINSPTLLDEEMRLRSRPISASPARSPASRAMSKAPRWGFWRAHGGGRDHGHTPSPRAPHHGHGRAGPPHHRRRGGQDLPADEREFRPLPPLDGVRGGRRGRRDRYKAYTDRAKADWQGWLATRAPPPNDLDRWGAAAIACRRMTDKTFDPKLWTDAPPRRRARSIPTGPRPTTRT
jgi:methylenetetrahydrofolate--tRNA-(uracil-5-)-methyltransferase